MKIKLLKEAANRVSAELSADIFLLNSGFSRGLDREIIKQVCARKRKDNVALIVVSTGGDADVAYRIARVLQDRYSKVIGIISGYCKSAGTLCALGANELIFGPYGELGPLDVQFAKKDEISEFASGLVVREALGKIQDEAYKVFEEYMLRITMASQGQISFKLASDVASRLTIGLFEPLHKQIDPVLLGDLERGMTIAKAYGERLQIKSKNYDSEGLQALAESYPSHGFVIDQREAEGLFNTVRPASESEQNLLDILDDKAINPVTGTGIVLFLSDQNSGETDEDATSKPAEKAAGRRAGSNAPNHRGTNGSSGTEDHNEPLQQAGESSSPPESAGGDPLN